MTKFSRKSFLQKIGATSAGLMGAPFLNLKSSKTKKVEVLKNEPDQETYSANDQINVGLIGAGIMGHNDAEAALENNGIKLVAACDLYDSRLVHCKELWGEDVYTTKDYREILDRDDIDSVIIATTDHWHDTITIEALEAGKAVYCEKPMVQHIEEGHPVIDAEQRTGSLLQIGSQSTSSLLNAKAKELLAAGEIGDLNFVESYWDRQSFMGAWNYSIPPSAGPDNIDWNTYLKDLPDMPFSLEKFFRWRKYRDFGTGVAGDLFVHHFSALHFITGSLGPERIYGTGGIRFWDDGRNVPDVMLALFDYPETENHPPFNLSLRVNFADGSGGGYHTKLVGSDGEMVFGGGQLVLRKRPMPNVPGMSIDNYSKEVQKEFKEWHKQEYSDRTPQVMEEHIFETGEGLGGTALHHKTLFDSMRSGEDNIVQDGTFGLRAAAPALAANISYFNDEPVNWDPENMRVV